MIRKLKAKIARLIHPVKRDGVERLAAAYNDRLIKQIKSGDYKNV